MRLIAEQLGYLLEEYLPQLNNIKEEDFAIKPSPIKWSKKEIIGHLIDSAQNNIRRFVVAQYEEEPMIVYDQDEWVSLNNYQQQPSEHVIQLWYYLNKQAVAILNTTSHEASQRKSQGRTIEWLGEDYIKHMKHHMHQVLDLEPVAYP